MTREEAIRYLEDSQFNTPQWQIDLVNKIYDDFEFTLFDIKRGLYEKLDEEFGNEGAGWVKKQYIMSSLDEYFYRLMEAINPLPKEELSKSE